MGKLCGAFKKAKKANGKGGPGPLEKILGQLKGMQPGDADPALLDAVKAEIDRISAAPAPMGPPPGLGAPAGGPPGMPPGMPPMGM